MSCGGYCEKHQDLDPMFESKQQKKSLKADMPKIRMLITGIGDTLVDNTAAKEFQLLQNFFREAEIELSKHPKCEECGANIPHIFYRASVAHVLPKRKEFGFPSVQSHPLNKLFLGSGCGCHKKYDDTWEAASKMKIWPKVIVIFQELYPFIHPSEHKNIPDVLRPYIPN
jgi:hypothetical protein